MTAERAQRIALASLVGLAAIAAITALGYPAKARLYALFAAVASVVLGVAAIYRTDATTGAAISRSDLVRGLGFLVWLAGYYALAALVGLIVASGLFVGLFLIRQVRSSARIAALAGVAVSLALFGLGVGLQLRWPAALLDLAAW